MGNIFPKLKPQLSEIRGLHSSGVLARLRRGCFSSPDNGIFVSLRQGVIGKAGKTPGPSFLTVFILHNVKNEDLTLWLFQDFIMQHFYAFMRIFNLNIHLDRTVFNVIS